MTAVTQNGLSDNQFQRKENIDAGQFYENVRQTRDLKSDFLIV